MKTKSFLSLMLLICMSFSCSEENANISNDQTFNLENFDKFSSHLDSKFSLINQTSQMRNITDELTIESYKRDVEELILEDDQELIDDFNITFDYYYNNYQFIEESNPDFAFNSAQKLEIDDLSDSIENSNDVDDAIEILNNKYTEVYNANLTEADKEVILLNVLIFREYFVMIKMNPELISAPFQSSSRTLASQRGWWDCFRRTAGKKIARGMVYGAVTGAIGGAKIGAAGGTVAFPGIGTATGAVGGAVFGAATGAITGAVGGALWAAADCF